MIIYIGSYSWKTLTYAKPAGPCWRSPPFIVSGFENSVADAFTLGCLQPDRGV